MRVLGSSQSSADLPSRQQRLTGERRARPLTGSRVRDCETLVGADPQSGSRRRLCREAIYDVLGVSPAQPDVPPGQIFKRTTSSS